MISKILYLLLCGLFRSKKEIRLPEYQLLMTVSRIRIIGINQLRIEGLKLVSARKYCVTIAQLHLRFHPRAILRKKTWSAAVSLTADMIHLQRLPPGDTDTPKAAGDTSPPEPFLKLMQLYRKISRVLFNYPLHITVKGFSFEQYRLPLLQSVSIQGNRISIALHDQLLTGEIQGPRRRITLRLQTPFDSHRGISVGALQLAWQETGRQEEAGYTFSFEMEMTGIQLQHRYISQEACHLSKIEAGIKIALNREKIAFTDDSTVDIDGCPVSVRIFSLKKTWPVINCFCVAEAGHHIIQRITARFRNRLLRVGDSDSIRLILLVKSDLFHPQKLSVSLDMQAGGFDTDRMELDLHYLKHPFVHTVAGTDKTIRLETVETTAFLPLQNIQPLLPQLVVFCEDPDFHKHAGVDKYFICKAVIRNIMNRKIVSGASTITMQLTKNLFLSPETSLLRKLEETAIALSMETMFSVPKDRILEIYLNIIEFAPMVYGVKEGTAFYFGKHPNELSLTEIIVLTYIIPRPVHFCEALLARTPQLTGNLRKYTGDTGRWLLQFEIITREDYENLEKKIVFSERFGTLDLS
ncbi:transglycosylase domain-containing protein [Chitinophaga sp. Mgbs1]|uniref:Transglycosylase domain-containing protein n=1 Tax=Chitinophaga solisilvae TaxID=1233460 RepID=A0A3S1D2D2_9BACT|nr:transglycosylase domain-containing protein [Chitinophaga solisilvae]